MMEQANLEYIEQISGGNLEFKTKMVGILKKELPVEIENYALEMKKSDFLSAAQSVHKLKHKISILGLEKSYYIAEEFEDNLKNNSTDLQADFDTILNIMSNFVIDM